MHERLICIVRRAKARWAHLSMVHRFSASSRTRIRPQLYANLPRKSLPASLPKSIRKFSVEIVFLPQSACRETVLMLDPPLFQREYYITWSTLGGKITAGKSLEPFSVAPRYLCIDFLGLVAPLCSSKAPLAPRWDFCVDAWRCFFRFRKWVCIFYTLLGVILDNRKKLYWFELLMRWVFISSKPRLLVGCIPEAWVNLLSCLERLV